MSLLLRWAFGVDSVDREIPGRALGALAECLEDKVADGEVLDLLEAALSTLDYREYFDRRVRAYPDSSPHPCHGEKNERERENRDGNVEDCDVGVCDDSAEDEPDKVEADNGHDSG